MRKTLLALALIGASSTAMADSWIYGGATVGQSDLSDGDATAYGVHVGTGILPFIGLEAGYWNHGELDVEGYRDQTQKIDAESIYFAAKPSIDFGPLHVYGKAGVHSYKLDGSDFEEDKVDLMYGVGAEYFIFGPLSLGASYNVFEVKDDSIKNFSLNATLHFL